MIKMSIRVAEALLMMLLLVTFMMATSVQSQGLLRETPYFQAQVASGKLPPIAQRIPQQAFIDKISNDPKIQPGGQLNILMAKTKDIRHMVVYGYARLMGFDAQHNLHADILHSYTVEEGRIFTFHLRAGHRWSDGHPFTTEDFRYYWEDVANNENISPFGIPIQLQVDGQAPVVEILDATTVRYSWQAPNPDFLLALAGASPLFLYRPAHYLKQFHLRYSDPLELEARVQQAKIKQKTWYALHQRHDHLYKFDNIELPTLQPWIPTTTKPSERFIFTRNPYYHRLDSQGNQQPYIDEVIMGITSSKLIPAKTVPENPTYKGVICN
jgi:peptide/nickel transport system substrate-binding protein